MARYPLRDTYTPELAGQICLRIANGEALRKICGPRRSRGIPDRVTVYNWLNRHPQFMRAYLVARRAQAELYLDEVVHIADGPLKTGDVPRDRLRVDTRFKLVAMLAPRTGAKAEAVGGQERRAPVEEMDITEKAARIAAILEGGRRRMIEEQERAVTLGATPEPLPALFLGE